MAVRMFRNRKGMFFTIVAIMIITILFVSFSPEYASRTGYEESVLDGRYEVANDFVNTLKTGYIPAAVEASSYHALQELSEETNLREGTFLGGFSNRDQLLTSLL